VERRITYGSVQESQGIINRLDADFGKVQDGIEKYETYSPFIYETENIKNLEHLQNIRIRLYTEPDTLWWSQNRQNTYEEMNAYYIKKLSEQMDARFKTKQVELIETVDKGYRSNGIRHPHSWSIVDKEDLLSWILNE